MRTLKNTVILFLAGLLLFPSVTTAQKQNSENVLDRSTLPIKKPEIQTYKELDARKTKTAARWEVKTSKVVPNVVVDIIDNMGFGNPVKMPIFNKLSKEGISYNCFYTSSICWSKRAALLPSYNYVSNNTGFIMETATAFPGNNAIRPEIITPIGEVLRQNGYSTAAYGKYHETPPWEYIHYFGTASQKAQPFLGLLPV